MSQKESWGFKIWWWRKKSSSATTLPQPLPPLLPPEVTYRYTTHVPNSLRLSLADLLTYIPANWIRKEYLNNGKGSEMVELSCAEIFDSPIPRISAEQLQNLLPRVLRIPKGIAFTTTILLPTKKLALAYHWSSKREEPEEEAKMTLTERPSPAFFASLPVFTAVATLDTTAPDSEESCALASMGAGNPDGTRNSLVVKSLHG